MPVYIIERDMPASELAGWYAHFHLLNEETELAAEKAKLSRG